jgi:hypothetical protein
MIDGSGMGWVCGAPGDGSLDRIIIPRRLNDKPKQNINHIRYPNRSVEVKTVTEHELPWGEGLRLEGLNGTVEC